MRFVVKPEAEMTDKLKSQGTKQKLLEIVRTKDTSKISDGIYRDAYDHPDGKRSYVEDALAKSYHNKCAYCERITKADIEHYRPKAKVDDATKHDGYYWLCYEWTNLLPSCVTCNREGAKHTKFPILGPRVNSPTMKNIRNIDYDASKAGNKPLKDEIPKLLHPEVDNPEDFFGFEPDSARKGIRLKSISLKLQDIERVKGTIEICKLNRQELCLDRLEIINEFLDTLNLAFEKYSEPEVIEKVFDIFDAFQLQSLNAKARHTLLRKYVIKNKSNFGEVVIPFAKHKKLVLSAFLSWKT